MAEADGSHGQRGKPLGFRSGAVTYLSITGQLLLSLLLVVFRVRIFSSADRGLVHFHSGMPVLHHHAPVCRCFSTILGELGFADALDGERPESRSLAPKLASYKTGFSLTR